MSQLGRHSWMQKFAVAARGVLLGLQGERSMRVHAAAAMGVSLVGWWLELSASEWGLLVLCMGFVIAAELLNTAVERLAAVVEPKEHPQIRDVLDLAAGGVLMAALAAAIVGSLIFWQAYQRKNASLAPSKTSAVSPFPTAHRPLLTIQYSPLPHSIPNAPAGGIGTPPTIPNLDLPMNRGSIPKFTPTLFRL